MISKIHYITQDHPTKSHQELALSACKGGAKWVQLRIKNKSEDQIRDIAREVYDICKQFQSTLILNDHVQIAKDLHLDGVHIGKEDMDPIIARKILGSNKIIGGTANTWEDVIHLSTMKVDYIGIGPFRFTSTKEKLSPVLGIEGYEHIVSMSKQYNIQIPLIAIGGININDIPILLNAGVFGIAVAGAINLQESPQKSMRDFLHKINSESNTIIL